jgi:anti-sigma regulatory factor (Ser/Thr protein kinase)
MVARVPAIDVELRGGPDAPSQAREAIRGELAPHLTDEERFELELLVTELVTNAVRHGGMRGGRTVGLLLRVHEDLVRVEVRDEGPGFTPGRPAPRDLEHGGGGLGLVLLDRYAKDWGVDVDRGACVWADIPRGAVA